MTGKKRDSPEGTRVDLGEDLLEPTRVTGVGSPLLPSVGDFESARILLNEGLTEEAKKILRNLLIVKPKDVGARELLHEIQEAELKQIFGESRDRKPRGGTGSEQEVDAEELIRNLDRDLELGDSLGERMSLFQEGREMAKFAEKLDQDLAGISSRDRIDIGIAFLEMGLYGIAAKQFKAASTVSLLAYALILDGKSFEAILNLQPELRDAEAAPESSAKVELVYLMGRAYEALGQSDLASQWYKRTHEIEPFYRDVTERLKRQSKNE